MALIWTTDQLTHHCWADGLGMMPNAGRVWAAWPGLYERLDPLCGHSRGITYRRWDGKWLVDQKPPPLESEEQAKAEEAERRQAPMFDCHRGDLHSTLLDYAKEIGIHVRQGVTVQRYEESDTDAAVIVDGERISATVVIGADGAKSKARELVLGYDDAPKSSGYAVFRCDTACLFTRSALSSLSSRYQGFLRWRPHPQQSRVRPSCQGPSGRAHRLDWA